jgi:hypothetical protein
MTTLFDSLLELARLVTDVYEGTATGGDTNTLLDTANTKTATYYDDGCLWLKLTTKVSKKITTHAVGSIDFTPAQVGAIAAGNGYAAAPMPRYVLIQALNRALQDIGPFPYQGTDTAVADQQDYDSDDDTIYTREIIGVEIATSTSSPYYYQPHYRWDQLYVGSKLTLRFDEDTQPDDVYPMRITYLDTHPELDTDDDTIHPQIDLQRLLWEAAIHVHRWDFERKHLDDPSVTPLLNEAQAKAQELRRPKPRRTPRLAKW